MDLIFTLDEVADMLRTDKASFSHGYTQYYSQLFKDKRKEIKAVLEIGIGNGGSLKLWRLYFPNAQIYGLDMNENDGSMDFGDRVTCYVFSQDEVEKLESTFKNKELEVIIDDASHEEDRTLTSLNALFPIMKQGGYYIIEDMNEKIPVKILNWVYVNRTLVKSFLMLPDKGTLEGNNYEYLIVIRKQ